jgi:hypothetical protein
MSLQQNMTRIRQSIPQGYFLGRLSAGVGPVEAIDPASLASHIVSTGIAAGSSGSGQQWSAGTVGALDPSLVIINGTLTVTALAGVTSLGSGLSIVGGTTLEAAGGSGHIYAPAVNGETPGPGLLADPTGQCIMVPTT